MDCEQLKSDEFEVLKAIYSSEVSFSSNSVSIQLSSANDSKHEFIAVIEFELSPNYPLKEGPNVAISAPWMFPEEKQNMLQMIQKDIDDNIGQSMIYTLVENFRSKFEELVSKRISQQQRQHQESLSTEISEPSVIANSTNVTEIYHGDLIQDRKSTFQGHLARVQTVDDVEKTLEHLKTNKKINIATHNMWAYRIVDGKIVRENCDDDGEQHAGSRLLHLLNILDAKNVLVVVSRWYGGIQLGPDRFKHINNAARDVLLKNGFIVNTNNNK